MNLKKVFAKYASIQNKLLIDYKHVIKVLQVLCQNKDNQHIDEGQILTKEDLRCKMMRPSDNMKAALNMTHDNYFKYDPFKHGNSIKTELPREYQSAVKRRKDNHSVEVQNLH